MLHQQSSAWVKKSWNLYNKIYTILHLQHRHYKEVLSRAQSVKHTLWIGTADIKDLYVEVAKRRYHSWLSGLHCKKCKRRDYWSVGKSAGNYVWQTVFLGAWSTHFFDIFRSRKNLRDLKNAHYTSSDFRPTIFFKWRGKSKGVQPHYCDCTPHLPFVCCGGPTRTNDLQVMSLASYQLLHSAL